MITYSQAGQDLWVLNKTNNKKFGYFLDIGAHNGIEYSNSYLLERDYGWNGILVEPNKNSIKKLDINRTSLKLNIAVGDKSSKVSLDDNGMSSKITDNDYGDIEMFTLLDILNFYKSPKYIDYLSLDVEGFEYNIIKDFDFDAYDIKLITVEHNLYLGDPTNKNLIKSLLLNKGYTLDTEDVQHEGFKFEDWYIKI
jgi:FkbM family methyltransferase